MSNFFLTCGSTLGAIFALCLTIHFFYAQSSTAYNSLIFIFDANKSKINYEIFTALGFITFFFFYLGGNYNSLIFKCPDTRLLPFSLVVLAFSLRLVIYHFNYVVEKLSPIGISKSINKYFKNNLTKLKKYEKLKKKYLRIIGVKEKNVGMIDLMDPLRYKLEALCDNYLKLIGISEYRLANDLLSNIYNCFSLLFKSYNPVYVYNELTYFTTKTIIDRKIENFFKKIISIIESCIKNNNTQGITDSINLYSNLIMILSDAKYEYIVGSTIIGSDNFLFYNGLYYRADLYEIIEKYDNIEAYFQWKEGLNKFLSELLKKPKKYPDAAGRLGNLLLDINKLNLWSIKHNKTLFELHETYYLCYSSLLYEDSIFGNNDLYDCLGFYARTFLIHKNSISPFFTLITKFISSYSDNIISMVQSNENYINKYFLFIDELCNILIYVSKLENVSIDTDVGLLIHELVYILYRICNTTNRLIDNGLYSIINLLKIVLINENNTFPNNYLFRSKIYDALCRIGIKAINDQEETLFENCFSIFAEDIVKKSNYVGYSNLSYIKFFCYWFFIDNDENHGKYLNIFKTFFERQKELYNNDSYGKNMMIRIIDEIGGCYEDAPGIIDSGLSYFVIRDHEGISYNHQEEIKNKVYEYCINIYD